MRAFIAKAFRAGRVLDPALWRVIAATLLSTAALSAVGCNDETETTTGGTTTSTNSTGSQAEVFGPLGQRDDLAVDDRVELDNLSGPVDVVRDKWGRPHIFASNVADATRVQGYLMVKDRALQMELLRRISEGRMAEILGQTDPTQIDRDIVFRHIGLHRVAKKQYEMLPDGETKTALEAFSDGVTQAYHKLQSGELKLPKAIFGIEPEFFTDWKPDDTLAIGRLQTYLLSYDADSDVSTQVFFDSVRSAFNAAAANPLDQKRTGFEIDFFRFAPATTATTTDGYPTMMPMQNKPAKQGSSVIGRPSKPFMMTALAKAEIAKRGARAAAVKGYLDALESVRNLLAEEGFGSNNWGVMPSKSATGHTLIASDPHLNLTAPAIFYPVSMEVKTDTDTFKVGGVAFPGIPGIILGHNENIAWGATVAGYDVSDAYAEELSADGKTVKFNGADVALEEIEETIQIQGKTEPLVYKVLNVPHHGPILPTITTDHKVTPPDPAVGAISIKWTGMEATAEVAAVFDLLRAKNVDDAYASLQKFGVGAQNWMIGDTSGNVLWTSHANVPKRDKKAYTWDSATYQGTLPCMVLPGDGTAEWSGYLADDLVPWVRNPSKGYIATANNDPIGDTLDNDPSNDTLPDGTPMFLGCSFDIAFREERIQTRIETKSSPFTTDDLALIQADHHSPMGSRLAPKLVAAIDRAEEEKNSPGTHPDLTAVVNDPAYISKNIVDARVLLDEWEKQHDFDAASGVNPDDNMTVDPSSPEGRAARATLLFNTWLVRVLRRTYGDELLKAGYKSFFREVEAKAFLRLVESDPAQFATLDQATGDSAIWDDLGTPEVESRDDRMIRGLLDAIKWIQEKQYTAWGSVHTLRFGALIPLYGELSIPPTNDKVFVDGFPRPGDQFNVDNCDFTLNTALDADPNFRYSHGPSQRFVIDMDPAGPKAFNAIPGGVIWDNDSPHFADEAEMWRRNQNHMVPFFVDDVVANKESRTVVALPAAQ
ncbi:MAG: penicillin acylase family protein [Polyangiaceae bacterium]|nr:penicillin acylase family protein [Polyangiaceae bacterium]